MKYIKDQENLKEKKILLRLDLNVPLKNGIITDQTRIDKILPVINFLIKKKSKILVVSHVGRPKGKMNEDLSLKPICKYLEKKIHQKVSGKRGGLTAPRGARTRASPPSRRSGGVVVVNTQSYKQLAEAARLQATHIGVWGVQSTQWQEIRDELARRQGMSREDLVENLGTIACSNSPITHWSTNSCGRWLPTASRSTSTTSVCGPAATAQESSRQTRRVRGARKGSPCPPLSEPQRGLFWGDPAPYSVDVLSSPAHGST